LPEPEEIGRFEEIILPHLPAAYNLARWLVRGEADAEDLVQESSLRAWRSFGGYRGGDPKSWLLAIVRNTCYTWLRRNRRNELTAEFDEGVHSDEADVPNPEQLLMQGMDAGRVREALEELPAEFREAIVLRELEGLSYKEISETASVPIGTVMSRLARGRRRLQLALSSVAGKET